MANSVAASENSAIRRAHIASRETGSSIIRCRAIAVRPTPEILPPKIPDICFSAPKTGSSSVVDLIGKDLMAQTAVT